MSDYALMRKMHDVLKSTSNELDALAGNRLEGEELWAKLNELSWDIQRVLREAEGH